MAFLYPLQKDSQGTIIGSGGPDDTLRQWTYSFIAGVIQGAWRKATGWKPK